MMVQRHHLGAPESPDVMTTRLLVLTDRSQLPADRDLVATVASCVDAGATQVVLRELDLGHDERADLAAGMVAVGAIVIAAHEPLPGCVGVHLPACGQASVAGAGVGRSAPRPLREPHPLRGVTRAERAPRPPAVEADEVAQQPSRERSTRMTAPPAVVGRSCHSREDVERAAAEGADYVTLSPYAATDSKPGYGPPLPPDAYAGHSIPVYALGGVTPANAAEAVAAGAHGVAVMGAVMRADDPAAVVSALLEEVPA